MDCEACTEGMIDLLFDELEDAEATRLRSHIAGCDECTEAYERLSLGQAFATQMEMVSPPAGLLDGVLAAAHERAAERAPEPRRAESLNVTPPREALPPEDEGLWAAVLKWVGGMAMRPQMAMAMTLVLMVGIGLWYLPELRRSDPADSQAIVDPSPVGEVGPSAALAPAAPLELEADPRTGRIRPRVDEPQARRARPSRPSSDEPAAPPPEVATQQDDVDDSAPQGVESEDGSSRDPATTPEALAALPPSIPPGLGEAVLEEGDAMELSPRQAMPPAGTPRRPSAMMAARVRSGETPADAVLAADDHAPPPPSAPSMDSEMVERPTVQETTLPTALHRQARNQRAANDCRSAVASYERLFSGHPRYRQTGPAQLEAGDCYRRLGRLGDARRMFERASRTASVATAARRELARLDAIQNATQNAVGAAAEAER